MKGNFQVFILFFVLFFNVVIIAQGSEQLDKKKLWKEYLKYKIAMDDVSMAPLSIQIEVQQKKLEAASKLVNARERLPLTYGILAWQYNNMGKLYINRFEELTNWSNLVEKLKKAKYRSSRKLLRKSMYEKVMNHLLWLDQALTYLEKARELNSLFPDKVREQKINNNIAYITTIHEWLNFYDEQ